MQGTSSLRLPINMDPDDNAPPVQLSKRDKRRTQLMDRLRELTDTFSLNKDTYYREQLGAIQEDMALILHAVPYVEDPTAEPTHELLSTMHKISRGDPKKMQALQQGDLSAAGNRLYHEFMDEIRDAMERRDATLTSFAVRHLVQRFSSQLTSE